MAQLSNVVVDEFLKALSAAIAVGVQRRGGLSLGVVLRPGGEMVVVEQPENSAALLGVS